MTGKQLYEYLEAIELQFGTLDVPINIIVCNQDECEIDFVSIKTVPSKLNELEKIELNVTY